VHCGAWQSGKTYVNYFVKLHRMMNLPPGRGMLIGKTQGSYIRNVIDPMREMFGSEVIGRVSGKQSVRILGRECQIFGANDAGASAAIMGFSGVYLDGDEFVLWPENVFRDALSRLSKPGATVDLTANPAGPRHWAKLWIDATPNLQYISYKLTDNTFADPEYVASMQAMTGVWYDRYVLGKWTAAEGLVYDMYDETVHVVPECPPCTSYWVGGDYGATAPTALVLIGRAANGLYYVVDEWYWDPETQRRQLTEPQLVEAVKTLLRKHAFPGSEFLYPQKIYFDPAAAGTINALKVSGWSMTEGAANDVISGIQCVGGMLSTRRLLIHERCQHVRDDLQSYGWDPKATETGEDKPIKKYDHAADGLRYALYSILGKGTTGMMTFSGVER